MDMRPHADQQYEAELRALRDEVLRMGALVEKQIAGAIKALVDRDGEAARAIIEHDHSVNRMDVEIDEMCLRLIALHQPTARDLRLITTALKITTDLERAGDMAEHICERVLELNSEPLLKPLIDIPRMAEIAREMLRESLEAFVSEDAALALKVCKRDDQMDALMDQIFRELVSFMIEDPKCITRAIRLTFVAKYLERIADHATNVAEMVVFMVKGKTIRHLGQVPPTV